MAVAESPAIRRAISIQSRVSEISSEVDLEEQSSYCNRLDALVLDCAALAGHWRSVVEHFSQQLSCGEDVDLRTAGDILRPVAKKTGEIYDRVKQRLESSSMCAVDASSKIDLQLAIRELATTSTWLATWPTWISATRDAARKDFTDGNVFSDEQLLEFSKNF